MSAAYGYRGPTIDHTLLSPSGRVSKRARTDAEKREVARLFPTGYWDVTEKSGAEKRADRAKALRYTANNLRIMASRGMSVRKFTRAAECMEAEANELEATPAPSAEEPS